MTSSITFDAVVYKVQTLIDGGIRLTLDLPEDAIPQAAMLMEARREQIPLTVEVTQTVPEQTRTGKKWTKTN